MRVFMLGWEFPPHISGGLGTACFGLTKGLDELGVEVCFVLPTAVAPAGSTHVTLRSPNDIAPSAEEYTEHIFEHVELHQVRAVLQAYGNPETFEKAIAEMIAEQRQVAKEDDSTQPEDILEPMEVPLSLPTGSFVHGGGALYHGDLMTQVQRYANLAVQLARHEKFDVIHAHDWMTYPAGLAVAAATKKPLVVHLHSTEFDRSGENIHQQVYDIERKGLHGADRVVCVSYLTRNIAINRYGVSAKKITVIYNAVELPSTDDFKMAPIRQDEKLVLFLGRVTLQKGPEYFLQAAKKVVQLYPNVRFIMAGSGDMITRCVELAASLKLGSHVTFTGFLRGQDVDRVFQMADLYVMPSVSEPFGIAPLEAMSHNVPVIISKQSGVSEVLTHVLKVDFWDTDEMANKILAVLRHAPLRKSLRDAGQIELRKFSWRDSADKLKGLYEEMCC